MADQRESPRTAPAAPSAAPNGSDGAGVVQRRPVDRVAHPELHAVDLRAPGDLTAYERGLLGDLFAIVEEHAGDAALDVDRDRVEEAFRFACEHHADQRRKSGEEFIVHPVGVAKICAGMRLDTETLVAALLHDTVEDTSASLEEVHEKFGEEVANLVDGVTKLTGITFTSRDEAQAENYRKMMVAMASDIRVILIKLADRLHNMRTIDAMPKQKQIEKAKETLEIYAPIAHRLGIHAIKWELEDLAFAALHPRKYQEIKGLVNQQREERERYVQKAGEYLARELEALGIEARISGRAKHFYSIYSKMTKKGREFNEIYDLTAMRVIVDSVKDCYGAVGVIHSLWKPLPGRFKDFIAMPKFNMYQSLHTTVIGPEGLPLEIQIRTQEMHDRAEFGVAAHWIYKQDPSKQDGPAGPQEGEEKLRWLRSMVDWQQDLHDPKEFVETLKVDLFDEEVFVFTPKGEVKSLAAGATPLDFAYEVHTEVGHRCVGAKVNGKIVPLNYALRSGDIVEILTSKRDRGPSRDWLALVKTTRARNKIKQFFKAESREDTEHTGRELLQEHLQKNGLPPQKIVSSPLLADVIREMGFRKADDFYIALGGAKISPKVVVNKVLQRLKQGEAAETDQVDPAEALVSTRRQRRQPTGSAVSYGIRVDGVDDVMLRLAKCCRPVPGDPIVGYVSLGRGITIHRDDCPNTAALRKDPERFVPVHWEGDHQTAFKVELQIDAWDRHRLLEDLSRTLAESGINIVEARCIVSSPMVQNRFVVEVADTQALKQTITKLRNIESVFDAYRITPGAS
ncbi:bifunctional (p)ppGpp synthetase/guanosine-3',5'-bis(diphosphate) 3'-pyrophosphohydrolase [Conexibacter sp. SYSU D00693]|uniref:RelA/SpoT family protein n=1 Tax=Conexibacter sp. SYSU D00693 TaxID=2812560 RepID=UPI001F120B4A|nr:bifunctional (p)ppGpp synthetase/guanosine-3',5'-bis(diphosphate) 3'-pyrophosphohydrolase [Conexibacter sp. SYSU D00693]